MSIRSGELENKIRKSLPNDSTNAAPSTPQRRNTVSSGFGNAKPKKPLKIPAIVEDDADDTLAIENERKREVKIVKKPSVISTASKSSFAYDNTAYEGNLKRSGSAANSERSTRTTASRAPSVQSLEIVREQYCCCSRRTRCEKTLLVVVTVLGIVIVVLVIAIAAVVKNGCDQNQSVSQVLGF